MRPAIDPSPEKFRRCVYQGIKPINRNIWEEAMSLTQHSEASRRRQENAQRTGNNNHRNQ